MDLLIKLLMVSLPLGVVLRLEVLPNAFLYPIDSVVSAFVLWFFITQRNNLKKIFLKGIGKAILLFVGFAFLSLIVNIQYLDSRSFVVSFLYLVRYVAYSFVLLSLVHSLEVPKKKYVVWLALSSFAVVVLGYIQYFLYPDLRNLYYLGWDEHLYRMFSTFLDPNFAGVFFVLVALLLVALFQEKQKYNRTKILYLIMSLATFGAVLLSYSRSAFIVLAMAFGIYFFLSKQRKVVLIFLVLLTIGIILLPKNRWGEGMNLFRTFSIMARFESVQNGFDIFQKSPIYGVGFNAYRYAQLRSGNLEEKNLKTHSGAGVSNGYVFLLATTGVVGLLLYLNIWRVIIHGAWVKNAQSVFLRSAVLASIGGLLVSALFENTLFYTSIVVWVYILVGLFMDDKSRE